MFAHMYLCTTCVPGRQMLEEGVGSPEIGQLWAIIMGAGMEFRSFVRTNLHYYLPSCFSSAVPVFEDIHFHISDTSYS